MQNKEVTTIKLRNITKARLDHLKVYRRETYDEILEKMLNILNLVRVNPDQARSRLVGIDKQKRRTQNEQKQQGNRERKDAAKPQPREIKRDFKANV